MYRLKKKKNTRRTKIKISKDSTLLHIDKIVVEEVVVAISTCMSMVVMVLLIIMMIVMVILMYVDTDTEDD